MKNARFSFELDIVKAKKNEEEQGDWIVTGYASTCDVDSDGMQITRQALEGAKDDLIKYNTVLFNTLLIFIGEFSIFSSEFFLCLYFFIIVVVIFRIDKRKNGRIKK